MKTLLKLLLLFSLCCASASAVEKTDLFEAGKEGYALYRIPGIVVTKQGTVLAYCEARKSDRGDWGPIDVLMRRSTDGGKTWGPRQKIVHVEGDLPINPLAAAQNLDKPGDNTVNNPVAIVDHETGAVHFLYCLEYMRCFYMRSDDDGATWTEPIEITKTFEDFRSDYDWKVLATGPSHAIQLTHGPKRGRLVVPVWLSLGTGGHAHRPSVTATIYSDDHGKTWKRGDIAVPDTPEFIYPNETVVVQLADGKVMLNSRSESKAHRRLVTISPDGATGWSQPRFDEQLLEPVCMAGIVRVRTPKGAQSGVIAFSNPHNLSRADGKETPGKSRDRRNVTIKLSDDEGTTWSASRTLEAGFSGYSDLAALPDGTILCFYERGSTDGKNHYRTDRLTVARLTEDWVRDGIQADICVCGGTSGGVVAAVQAARMGKCVVLIEPGRHLGGMTSGGLSAVDIGEPRSVGGIAREYFSRLVANYGRTLNWDQPFKGKGGPATGGAYSIEPHVAERVFEEMVREAGVTVLREARLASVKKEGARIVELTTEDGRTVRAKTFLDTTYEGDLLSAAGVSYTVMREGNAKYGETYNGIHYAEKYKPRINHRKPGANGRVPGGQGVWDRDFPLDPYIVKGDPTSGLLPLVSEGEPGKPGDPAPGVMAYCLRLCLSTADDRLPIKPPPDYDPKTYELVARFIEACQEIGDDMDLRWFSKHDPLPNQKWDFNTATFGGNLPGVSWEWPEASYDRRAEIAKEIENYHRGLLHFLVTDPRVPAKVRTDAARFGLPRDEFTDRGGWPHQIYVREGRRMVSDLVLTEHHTFGRKIAPDSIGLGSYGTDIHEIRRIVKDGVVIREGKVAGGRGGFGPYQIGYGAIVPKQSECENLFATFALSASHSAFASVRMEPVFMVTSQSAATAACLAIDDEVAVQGVDHEKLKTRLLADGQVLSWPPAGVVFLSTRSPARAEDEFALQLLGASDVQIEKLDAGRKAGLLEWAPVNLPINPPGDCNHYGWPVATMSGDTIVVMHRRIPGHRAKGAGEPHPKMSYGVVLRSSDGGITWSEPYDLRDCMKPEDRNRGGIVPLSHRAKFDKANKSQLGYKVHLHAIGTARDGAVIAVNNHGVFRSDDAGRAWKHFSEALREDTFKHAIINIGPRILDDPKHGLLVFGNWFGEVDQYHKYSEKLVVLRSPDGGATWQGEEHPAGFKQYEPAAIFHDGQYHIVTRDQNQVRAHRQMTWLPGQKPTITKTNLQDPRLVDTVDLSFNPVAKRFEIVRSERHRMELWLWSIAPEDWSQGEWRRECRLFQRQGKFYADADGFHPAGAVIDEKRGVQHIFIYTGHPNGPAGVFRLTRTLDTPKLVTFLRKNQ